MKKIFTILLIALALGACVGTRTRKEVFIVDLNSPQISMGEIEVQMNKTFPLPGIKKSNITMSYFPNEDAVCLRYRDNFMTYHQFWSRSGRAAFVKALEEYKVDYAARNLDIRGGIRAKRKYGNADGYLIWQMSSFTTRASGEVKIEFGYTFKENSPYFTVNQCEALYVDPLAERDRYDTPQIPMYFTRAQADELVILFDQEYLQGLIAGGAFSGDNSYDDYNDEKALPSENETQTDEY